jgi:hypothetical protein
MLPAPTTPLVLSETEAAEFKTSIERDFAIARSHQKNGMYELVVTPSSYVLRRADKARTRADFDGFGCSMAHLVTALYEQYCPSDVVVRTTVETPRRPSYETTEKEVYLLRVRFTFTQNKKKSRHFF